MAIENSKKLFVYQRVHNFSVKETNGERLGPGWLENSLQHGSIRISQHVFLRSRKNCLVYLRFR